MLENYLAKLRDQEADALQLSGGHPPILFYGTEQTHLEPKKVDHNFVSEIATQRLSPTEVQTLHTEKRLSGTWNWEEVGVFDYVFKVIDGQLILALRPSRINEHLPDSDQETEKILKRLNRINDLESMMIEAVLAGASDIVFSEGRMSRVRFGRGFHPLRNHQLSSGEILGLLGDKLNERKVEQLNEHGSADLAIELTNSSRAFRFRVNLFRQFDGLAAAWRPIWDQVPDITELGLPEEMANLLRLEHGLILITGPTGSGKSTSVAARIDKINQTERRHIVTLEDPVEYRFKHGQSLIHQREIGVHVDSFGMGLRAALREAPNVIFVGEMRDLETISSALTAAETGHLVVSTLHSGNCIQALDRMIDVFPEHQQQQIRIQLADVLRVVVTQRLLPRADGHLRVPACEILVVNYAVSNLIRERRTHQIRSNLQTSQAQGMLSLERSLLRLLEAGSIDGETALRAANDPKQIEAYLGDKN